MISQYAVPRIIATELPQLSKNVYYHTPESDLINVRLNIYKSIQTLTTYTRLAVVHHRFTVSRQCFSLANRLYANGDPVIRSVIENCFIYSFSSFMPTDKTERIIIKSMIPPTLYNLYITQATESGC